MDEQNHSSGQERRFDRLEAKIDKLTDAVTQIVRVEEQLISNNRRLDAIEQRMNKAETDIDGIGNIARSNGSVARFADKLFWAVVATTVGIIAYIIQRGIG